MVRVGRRRVGVMRTVFPLALLLPFLYYNSLPLYCPPFLLPLPLYFSLLPHLSLLPQAALVETDSRSDDLEKRNHLLEGEVADLRQNLKEQSQADEHIMALMNAKTKEWQVSCDPPASSFPSTSLRPSSLFLLPFLYSVPPFFPWILLGKNTSL